MASPRGKGEEASPRVAASPRGKTDKGEGSVPWAGGYKPPKHFQVEKYAQQKYQFTLARKELAAYAYLCRQQEAREWMELLLGEKFPENKTPTESDPPTIKKSYKSDLFPVLQDGQKICQLMNVISAGCIPKINKSEGKTFLMLENINFFLTACRKLDIPEHKLFLPLDLQERKNMPKVIYCIHELAAVAYARKLIQQQIVDRTGQLEFDPDELDKAARELEEIEQRAKGGQKTEAPKTPKPEDDEKLRKAAEDAENDQHNKEQIAANTRHFVLDQLQPATVIVEGLSKAENVSGSADNNYALAADFIFQDGSKRTEHMKFNTGTHDWEQSAFSFTPDKPIKEVKVYPIFHDHTGKVWFDRFGCFENKPPSNLIQFLENPSFEHAGDKETNAAHWTSEGKGYLRTGDTHTGSGSYSVCLNEGGGVLNKAIILQNTPSPIYIDAFSRAENVSGKEDKDYAVVCDVKFMDGSEKKGVTITFPTGTHDWASKSLVINENKNIKEIDFKALFHNHTGKVWFDHCTVSQDAMKQYVLNPSFEDKGKDENTADHWEKVDKGYDRNFREHCVYGGASIECVNTGPKDSCVAKQVVHVNQKAPHPLIIEGFSKANGVSGQPDKDYAIVADFVFQDGSEKKGQFFIPFKTGTHDWDKEGQTFTPDKAVKDVHLYCIFKTHTGEVYFDNITVSEKFEFGESKFFQMQRILRSLGDGEDWIQEMQALKQRFLDLLRTNHILERELQLLDKKIAAFIKNKGDVQEVLQASKRLFKLFKVSAPKVKGAKEDQADTTATIKYLKANQKGYQNLFYILQTEPKYLAKLLYLISPEEMLEFMETVILTLYGDNFSPREEFLLLKLIEDAVKIEISAYKDFGKFLENSTVITKMIVTYNRREQGEEYLALLLQPYIKDLLSQKGLEIELSAMKIHNQLIAEEEMKTGKKSTQKRSTSDAEALTLADVRTKLGDNVNKLLANSEKLLEAIVASVDKLPYGIRWICKKISHYASEKFPSAQVDSVQKVIGYFVYYRFINPALVQGDILHQALPLSTSKSLLSISKVMQALFNFTPYNKTNDTTFAPINAFIEKSKPKLREYFQKLISVSEPQDHLMVDQYVELTIGTKPLILISYDELYSTHSILLKHLDAVSKDKNDPVRVILSSLGKLPEYDLIEGDRQITLELVGQFSEEKEKELKKEISPFERATEYTVELLRLLPLENRPPTTSLFDILAEDGGGEPKVKDLQKKINDCIMAIEKDKKIDKNVAATQLLDAVVTQVDNLVALRAKRLNEIKRLKLAIQNLEKNQTFMQEQLQSYEQYLRTVREKNLAVTGKEKDQKKKKKGIKLSYSQLTKQGIIVDSKVPENKLKHTNFVIAQSEQPGIYTVKCKIAGFSIESVELSLDDLIEKQTQGIPTTTIADGDVTLDVNLTLHLINKDFLGK